MPISVVYYKYGTFDDIPLDKYNNIKKLDCSWNNLTKLQEHSKCRLESTSHPTSVMNYVFYTLQILYKYLIVQIIN